MDVVTGLSIVGSAIFIAAAIPPAVRAWKNPSGKTIERIESLEGRVSKTESDQQKTEKRLLSAESKAAGFEEMREEFKRDFQKLEGKLDKLTDTIVQNFFKDS